jgi:predicted small lipoprotein YifL
MRARPLLGALGIAAMLLAGGCGQKGPLFLPDKNKSALPPPAAVPTPAPAPAAAPVPDKDPRDKDGDNPGS